MGGGGGERDLNVRPKTCCVKAKIDANHKIDLSHETDHRKTISGLLYPGPISYRSRDNFFVDPTERLKSY